MTDKVAGRGVTLRAMIEMKLPCCDGPVVMDPAVDEIRCEACGLTLDLAPDARESPAADVVALSAVA